MSRKKRLLISEIERVAAVDEPDNPPASLLFWKKRTPASGDIEKGVPMDEITEAEAAPVVVDPVEPEIVKSEEVEADEVEKQREEIAKVAAQRDAALASLAEEVAKRLDSEWVEKARPYGLLLGSAETIGPVLRKIATACPDEYGVLEGALQAALGRADLAKILTEVGQDTGSNDPVGRRDSYVAEMRKLHPAMSEAEARARFWEQNPEAKKASREGV